MKVAFATHDMKTVDAHFGGARNMAIYEVSPAGHHFLEAVQFDDQTDESGDHDGDNDRLGAKIEALKGCALLFVAAIGGPAAARVVNSRIHPIKVPAPEPIPAVLARIQTMLNGNPPPWMRKILAADAQAGAMDFLEEEDR